MRIRVHRGTQQIGGTCIELESRGKRIVLDLGLPLDANSATDVGMPDVVGLTTGQDDTLLGIIISHPHQDHWGILPLVDPKIPVYIGAAQWYRTSERAERALMLAILYRISQGDVSIASRL